MTTSTTLTLPTPKNDAAKELLAPARLQAFQLAMPAERRGDWQSILATYVIAANELTKPCTAISVAKSAYNGCRLGLSCGAPLNHAFLVPFWNKRKNVNECQLIPGYEGFLDLAYGSKFVAAVTCQVWLRDEPFKHFVNIAGEQIDHDITDRGEEPSRNNIMGAYCLWQTAGGARGVKVVNRKQIDKVDKDADVWKSNYEAMCLKTVIRRAAKLWKKTPLLSTAIYLDEQAERDEPQDGPEVDTVTDEAPFSLKDLPDDEQADIEESARKLAEANAGH